MQTSEEKFFENLARYGKAGNISGGTPDPEPETDTEPEPEPEPEAVLAKAVTAPARPPAAARRKEKESLEPEGSLTIDVYQTPDDLVVQSAIAGVRPEDLDIEVSNDAVTVRGSRHREQEVNDDDYFYQECYWGRFSRSVILPQEVDPEGAEVTFKNGILSIRLPKLVRKKSRKLKVKTD